jgi:hypothetical protein
MPNDTNILNESFVRKQLWPILLRDYKIHHRSVNFIKRGRIFCE